MRTYGQKKPWQKILNPLQSAASKFLALPFHKKTGYFLLLLPIIAITYLFIVIILYKTEVEYYDGGVLWSIWKGESNTIPLFLGIMLISGVYLIKDRK